MSKPLTVQEFLRDTLTWPSVRFPVQELFFSDTALLQDLDNLPTVEQLSNVRLFVTEVLVPLRNVVWNGALPVTSCFRAKAVNELVGGVADSYHLATRGAAADLTTASRTRESVVRLYESIAGADNLPFAELIFYQIGTPRIHIGWDKDPAKNQRELWVKAQDGSYRRYQGYQENGGVI